MQVYLDSYAGIFIWSKSFLVCAAAAAAVVVIVVGEAEKQSLNYYC